VADVARRRGHPVARTIWMTKFHSRACFGLLYVVASASREARDAWMANCPIDCKCAVPSCRAALWGRFILNALVLAGFSARYSYACDAFFSGGLGWVSLYRFDQGADEVRGRLRLSTLIYNVLKLQYFPRESLLMRDCSHLRNMLKLMTNRNRRKASEMHVWLVVDASPVNATYSAIS